MNSDSFFLKTCFSQFFLLCYIPPLNQRKTLVSCSSLLFFSHSTTFPSENLGCFYLQNIFILTPFIISTSAKLQTILTCITTIVFNWSSCLHLCLLEIYASHSGQKIKNGHSSAQAHLWFLISFRIIHQSTAYHLQSST